MQDIFFYVAKTQREIIYYIIFIQNNSQQTSERRRSKYRLCVSLANEIKGVFRKCRLLANGFVRQELEIVVAN